MDRRGSDPSDSSRKSTSALRGLFCVCCVVDIFRYLHPSTPGFTWTKWNGALAFSAFLLWVSSAKCSVVVAIVVVQFLLHVSGSLGASRSFQL